MAYRIIEGRLQRQDVVGGRWVLVDGDEESRILDAAGKLLSADVSKRAPSALERA